MKTIGLYGIDGLYNMGCEAIVRGAEIFLRKMYPEAKVIYYSHYPQEDKKILNNTNISVEPIRRDLNFFQRLVNKMFRGMTKKNVFAVDDFAKIVREVDFVCSIGGDIYTIPFHLLDNPSYSADSYIVDFGEYVVKRGVPCIAYGASIGPFGSNKKNVSYFFNHLDTLSAILCREQKSIDYLSENGLEKKVFLYPDPAFSVIADSNSCITKEKRYIGVNLSPLSLKEIYGDVTQTEKEKLAALLDKIIEKYDQSILLIPHVLSPSNVLDNDYHFLREIQELIKHRDRALLIKPKKGFLEVKEELRKCECVIGARMHLCINAVCEGIPTLFLAYSSKAVGMCEYVYGNEKWLIPLNQIDNMLLLKLDEIKNNSQELRVSLKSRISEIQTLESMKHLDEIRGFVEKSNEK